MDFSFSWARSAAAAFRARAGLGLGTNARAAETWDVDLEAATWKCRAPDLEPWLRRSGKSFAAENG